jgi:hypothetical protein
MTPIAVKLEATKTYTQRRAMFLAIVGNALVEGRLTIITAKKSGKDTVETYDVQRDGDAVMLAKIDGQDVYAVNGKTCTCRAGSANKPCKHADSIRSLKAAGAIWPGFTPPPGIPPGGSFPHEMEKRNVHQMPQVADYRRCRDCPPVGDARNHHERLGVCRS